MTKLVGYEFLDERGLPREFEDEPKGTFKYSLQPGQKDLILLV